MLKPFFLPLVFLLSTSAQAGITAQFNNFVLPKDGLWENVTSVVDGAPNAAPVIEKVCINKSTAADGAAAVTAMLGKLNDVTQCKTTVIKDTKDAAESEQRCDFGASKSIIIMKSHRESPDLTKTTIETNVMGKTTKTVSTSRYIGACSAADAKPVVPAMQQMPKAECDKTKAAIEQMKAQCKSQTGDAQKSCTMMLSQMTGLMPLMQCK